MLRLGAVLFVVSLAWFAASQPIDSEEGWVRLQNRPLPGRMMIVRNYLVRQPYGNAYDRQASMSSFAAGSLATGSFYGGRRNPGNQLVNEQPQEEEKAEDKPEEKPEEEDPQEEGNMEEVEEKKPKAPRVAPKAPKAPKRRAMADDEDEEEDYSPRSNGRKNENFPTYSNFFPIVFTRGGGGSRRRSSGQDNVGEEEGEGVSPGLIAISNSFSNGRGAIASSTATAYGGPAPANSPNQQYRKSSPSRYRS